MSSGYYLSVSWLPMWIYFNAKVTLIICQISPKTMCSRFYMMNCGFKLITTHPIERADSIARFRFSILWYMVAGAMLMAYGEMGGTLPGTALLMSLLDKQINTRGWFRPTQPQRCFWRRWEGSGQHLYRFRGQSWHGWRRLLFLSREQCGWRPLPACFRFTWLWFSNERFIIDSRMQPQIYVIPIMLVIKFVKFM